PFVPGRPRLSVVGRLEEAVALDDRPEVLGPVAGVRGDVGDAEMPRRLLRRVVPVLARLVLRRAMELPRLAAVAALEDAGWLGPREHPAMGGREARDLRQLPLGVVAVGQALARLRPRLAEVGALPDGRAVPLARGGGVDRAVRLVVHGVVDRPPLAERAADVPAPPVAVAFDHEAAFPSCDQQQHLRHRLTPPGLTVARYSTPQRAKSHRSGEHPGAR